MIKSIRVTDGLIVGSVADMQAAGGGRFVNYWGNKNPGEYDTPPQADPSGQRMKFPNELTLDPGAIQKICGEPDPLIPLRISTVSALIDGSTVDPEFKLNLMASIEKYLLEMSGKATYRVDPGHVVLCDMCGTDFTDRNDVGGMLFGSKAVCPVCVPGVESDAKKYNETSLIRERCPDGKSFADWVRGLR